MKALHGVLHGLKRSMGDAVDRATFSVLAVVRRAGSLRPTELAERVGLDGSTVSRHVSNLADRGLVERTRDPEDARAQRVALTEAGEAYLDRLWAERAAALDVALDHWSAADRGRLVALLQRLAEDIAPDQEQHARPRQPH